MTPKQKSKELVEKFLPEVRGADRYNYNLESMNVFIAKQCALIAVEEVIKASPSAPVVSDNGSFSSDIQESTNFWNEVKTEITNL